MDNQSPICHRCMHPKGNAVICPNCGYVNGSVPVNPAYLKPETLLDNRYIVGNLLYSTHESAVYIAYDIQINTVVEVKEFLPDSIVTRNPETQELEIESEKFELFKRAAKEFLTQNQALSKIRTMSTLVQAYEIFAQNNTCYVIMEHVEGVKLKDYLLDHYGELSWEETSKMFLPVIKHLGQLHAMGLVHGGLSPETIYVTVKGQVKIGGFCIPSMRMTNAELPVVIYDGYAAPEQYENEEQSYGSWVDVYGMAAVLYKTLTGTMPTDSKSRTCVDNLVQLAVLNPAGPNNVSVAITSAMTLSFRIRTQTMTDLYAAFSAPPRQQAAIAEKVESLIQEQELDQETNNTKKYIMIAVGITAAVLILVSALVLYYLFGNNSNDKDKNTSSILSSEVEESSSEESSSQTSSKESSSKASSSATVSNQDGYLMLNLVGQYLNVVKTDSKYSMLTVEAEYEYNEQYPEGVIIKQSIEPDEPIKEGQTVKVTVSNGSKYREIPQYTGQSWSAYKSQLDNLGILYDTRTVSSEGVASGTVVATSIDPGQKIDVTTSRLVVSIAE